MQGASAPPSEPCSEGEAASGPLKEIDAQTARIIASLAGVVRGLRDSVDRLDAQGTQIVLLAAFQEAASYLARALGARETRAAGLQRTEAELLALTLALQELETHSAQQRAAHSQGPSSRARRA